MSQPSELRVPLSTIVREWGRIGLIGFGGPPSHIVLIRRLCVDEREWLTPHEFEDGIAATNLLPGPASTQLAIYCAWRLRGSIGAVVGGVCFIVPGLAMILALAALLLSADPPPWVLGAAAGAGAAVPAVALNAALELLPASWRRAGEDRAVKVRWIVYFVAGAVSAATVGPFLVVVLLVCGVVEIAVRSRGVGRERQGHLSLIPVAVVPVVSGGIAALCWVALKVGALSYGGGFVIIPLMQHDAVDTYHWMTGVQFLNAVALGQITPGPVVQTVAVVGYAASGLWGGLLAAAVAFAPSFVFIIVGARHFDRLRSNDRVQAFFIGAGSAVIGAIAGSAIPLGMEFAHFWQLAVLALAAIWLLALRRGVVTALLGAGALGVLAVLAGAPS
jgi:chromate transporter